jgi:hypothetical protein
MSRVRSVTVLGVAIGLVVLGGPPGASARSVSVHVDLKEQNGYRLSIAASRHPRGVVLLGANKIEGPDAPAPLRALSRDAAAETTRAAKASDSTSRRGRGFVSVQVQNGHAVSTYGALGTVTHNRLYAKLGDLGRVSLHFHLDKRPKSDVRCLTIHQRRGTFNGHVRFRGEDDYVDVDEQRMTGKVDIVSPPHDCSEVVPAPQSDQAAASKRKPASHRHHRASRFTIFEAKHPGPFLDTEFAAVKKTRGSTYLYGQRSQMLGPVLVDRTSVKEGKPGDLRVNRQVTRARVHPTPAAFRGSAHFNKDHHRWLGSLYTSFPGASRVHLAGPRFRARLVRYDLPGR